jgi:[ribosomal protein S18]-alanine N-acetyltransferase
MRSPLDYFRRRDFALERLKSADATAMAKLHGDGFQRPWNDGEFRSLLSQGSVFGFMARQVGQSGSPSGFVMARIAAGEAEILTIAVARGDRRAGLGSKLMEAVLRQLHMQRADALFLEVDEVNIAAIALYKRLGFTEVARRPAYYQTGEGKTAALVMRLDLK